MRGRRHLAEQPRLDIDTGDEHVHRVGGRGGDGVLPLDEEQAELLAPAALVQPAEPTGDAAARRARRTEAPTATVS